MSSVEVDIGVSQNKNSENQFLLRRSFDKGFGINKGIRNYT